MFPPTLPDVVELPIMKFALFTTGEMH